MKYILAVINYLCLIFSDEYQRTLGVVRSNKWPYVRKQFLSTLGNDICAICQTSKDLAVHHIVPVHLDFKRELDLTGLITLCEVHHLWIGHLGSWYSYNKDIRADAKVLSEKIYNRP